MQQEYLVVSRNYSQNMHDWEHDITSRHLPWERIVMQTQPKYK